MAARVTGDTSDATHLAGNAVTDRTKAPGACGSVDTHHAADAFTDFALMSYNIGIQNAEIYGGKNWTNKYKRLQDDVKSAFEHKVGIQVLLLSEFGNMFDDIDRHLRSGKLTKELDQYTRAHGYGKLQSTGEMLENLGFRGLIKQRR